MPIRRFPAIFQRPLQFRRTLIDLLLQLKVPINYPQIQDALHAGWTAVFKHPMNIDELRRPPCVGEGAYSDEELAWCTTPLYGYHLIPRR